MLLCSLHSVWGDKMKEKEIKKNFPLLIVPTFDTKVTEYLCSGCVFFLQTNFDFLTSHFDKIFLYQSKAIVVLSLNFS